jgi:hypothetical protein
MLFRFLMNLNLVIREATLYLLRGLLAAYHMDEERLWFFSKKSELD